MIDPKIVDLVIEKHLGSNADYTSNVMEKTFPLGMHTEVINFKVLEEAFNKADKDYEREHVTPYIYKHPEIFKLQSIKARGKLFRPELRSTVDMKEDFELIAEIYKHLYNLKKIFTLGEVISLLDARPEFVKINVGVEQKNPDLNN